jgi:hypothetical protein
MTDSRQTSRHVRFVPGTELGVLTRTATIPLADRLTFRFTLGPRNTRALPAISDNPGVQISHMELEYDCPPG